MYQKILDELTKDLGIKFVQVATQVATASFKLESPFGVPLANVYIIFYENGNVWMHYRLKGDEFEIQTNLHDLDSIQHIRDWIGFLATCRNEERLSIHTTRKERMPGIKPRKVKKCDDCEAVMINGVFCHETGCPSWQNPRQCDWCGNWFEPTERGQRCCDEDCQTAYNG
jgi:hypothetical protein